MAYVVVIIDINSCRRHTGDAEDYIINQGGGRSPLYDLLGGDIKIRVL